MWPGPDSCPLCPGSSTLHRPELTLPSCEGLSFAVAPGSILSQSPGIRGGGVLNEMEKGWRPPSLPTCQGLPPSAEPGRVLWKS